MADYTVSAKITGDASEYQKAFSEAQKAADNTAKKMENISKAASQSADSAQKATGKSLEQIAAESGKTTSQLRSDIMKSAAEYQKAGMTKSEAMKKAYEDIGYQSDKTSEKIRDDNQKSEKSFDDLSNKISGVADKVDKVGENIEGVGTKLMAVTGVFAGVGIAGVNSFDNLKSATNQFFAKTGITEKAVLKLADGTTKLVDRSEIYGDVMKDIYANNYGESFEDIGDAMADVMTQLKYLDSASLQNVTEDAFTLRDTFGYEITESARAANSMVTQFGIDADEAMNLIAQGAQNGLDYSGELLDTINEYSPQFQKLGLDAANLAAI